MTPTLVWFRMDLRLTDNPALLEALATPSPVIPVFIWSPEEENPWSPGAASNGWLHRSLLSLQQAIRSLGGKLIIRRGPVRECLMHLAKETGARRILWNRRYEPPVVRRDQQLKESLRSSGLEAESFNAALFHEPWTIRNQSGRPFQVFTPYWKTCLAKPNPDAPAPSPQFLPPPSRWPKSEPLDSLGLLPRIRWDVGLMEHWTPGETGAHSSLEHFIGESFDNYSNQRDHPGIQGTSRLSPHLHFGEIGPRQVWHAIQTAAEKRRLPDKTWRSSQYLAEIGWREFAHHLLFHFPRTPEEPLREEFRTFPWKRDKARLRAWTRGRTGYPLVDAGMRELWHTGWMHNRVRMVVASFLVKHLLIPWQDGAAWFWDTLVDADLASNTLGWQWSAGCGADAAPYFRVFNPVLQGEKFDPNGVYVRKWVPEIAKLPDATIHRPWDAGTSELFSAGVELGRTYPRPIVDHTEARAAALAAYASFRP